MVSNFTYVGHAGPDALYIGYDTPGWWNDEELEVENFQRGAFSDDSEGNLVGGCRTAYSGGKWGTIFWDNQTLILSRRVGKEAKGSNVRVWYSGGVVEDEDLIKKNNGKIKTYEGTGGTSNQTESQKNTREKNRPTSRNVTYAK